MWNISKKNAEIDNKGLTLVELLVALAVSAIILTGLSYIIVSVIKFYARTNANVEAQNETQTALNLVIDSIIGTKGVCLREWSSSGIGESEQNNIYCVLLGKLELGEDKKMKFLGDAILWQPSVKEMYLMSGTFELGYYTDEVKAPLEALTAMSKLLPAEKEERLPFLMAQNVVSFDIKTLDSCFADESEAEEGEDSEEDAPLPEKYYFNSPLAFNISIEVEYQYQNGKTVTRTINDSAYVRNRLKYVYVQRLGSSGMIKYLCNTN